MPLIVAGYHVPWILPPIVLVSFFRKMKEGMSFFISSVSGRIVWFPATGIKVTKKWVIPYEATGRSFTSPITPLTWTPRWLVKVMPLPFRPLGKSELSAASRCSGSSTVVPWYRWTAVPPKAAPEHARHAVHDPPGRFRLPFSPEGTTNKTEQPLPAFPQRRVQDRYCKHRQISGR